MAPLGRLPVNPNAMRSELEKVPMACLAKQAIGTFSSSERIALGFTGSLPKGAIPVLQDKVVEAFNELASRCEEEPRQVVYHLGMVLFPLSDPRGTKP